MTVFIIEVPAPTHITCPHCHAKFKGYLPLDGTRRPMDRDLPALCVCEECMKPYGADMRTLETWKLSQEEFDCLDRNPEWQRSMKEARRLKKMQTN